MKRPVLLLGSMVLALLLACGVALAATIDCTIGQETCQGTADPDTINGTEKRDIIHGLEGDDTLLGNGGNDVLLGGPHKDTLRGGIGLDALRGKDGVDKLYGGPGGDNLEDSDYTCVTEIHDPNVLSGGSGDDKLVGWTKLYGGSGDDYLRIDWMCPPTKTVVNGGPGRDRIWGNRSKDTIFARDREKDTIACGSNTDTVYFDKGLDYVSRGSCENLNPPQ